MIDSILADECRALAATIAPELGEQPLYLLDGDDLANVRREPCNTLAYCDPQACAATRDFLIARGEWFGQGNVIVFSQSAIAVDCGNPRRATLEVFLHEICHLLPVMLPSPDREPTPLRRSIEKRRHLAFVTKPEQGIVASDHGARFIRVACHVWFRAVASGFIPAAHWMFAGFTYGLSHPHEYLETLADEPMRMLACTFAEIQATPPPPAFTDLAADDLIKLEPA